MIKKYINRIIAIWVCQVSIEFQKEAIYLAKNGDEATARVLTAMAKALSDADPDKPLDPNDLHFDEGAPVVKLVHSRREK